MVLQRTEGEHGNFPNGIRHGEGGGKEDPAHPGGVGCDLPAEQLEKRGAALVPGQKAEKGRKK
jgi:hypothetical protein